MEEIAADIFVETAYPGMNVGVIATPEGLVCIDSPPCPADAYDWTSRLRSAFKFPIRYLILTDYNPDRLLMSGAFRARIIAHEKTHARVSGYGPRLPAPIMDSIATRYDLLRKELNGITIPEPQVSFCEQATLFLGEREITVLHMPSATPGSLWVLVKDEELVFSGDTVVVDQHPALAEADSKSWLDALTLLRRDRFKAETIVPGRGPLSDRSATEPVSRYIRMARRRVHALYRAGRPRADTTALIPTFMAAFPHDDVPKEWLQRQLKAGLDHLYDEHKAAETVRERRAKQPDLQ
jgi:glyoxylase-like metal-dependent hydrolase (beta-lactamase superfamily II)